jgi:hypothetical protein
MPLALTSDTHLKNFTAVIPPDHDMDSILMAEFIQDFRRPGIFQSKQGKAACRLQLMVKTV